MRQNTLGKLIEKTREKRKISKVKLCRGLCTITALTRYELDIRIPDKFLADALLERLGLNPFNYEFISSEREFSYRLKRTQLESLLCHNNVDEALTLLYEYEKETKKKDSLHKQYILLMRAIICGKKTIYDEGIEILRNALVITDCTEDNFANPGDILLTDTEMKIIYMLAKYLYYAGYRTESYEKFNILKEYIDKMNWDDEKLKEYYPHIMYRLAQQEIDSHNLGKAWDYLIRAEELLICNYKLDNLYEILELKQEVLSLMNCMQDTNDDEFIKALKIISCSENGEIVKEGKQLWENTASQQL